MHDPGLLPLLINTQALEKYQFILPYSILLETTERHHRKHFSLLFLLFHFLNIKTICKNSTKNPLYIAFIQILQMLTYLQY